jgi:LAO/AO transport system kinase
MSSRALSPAEYCAGVRAGDRRLVAKTITLLESRRADHLRLAEQVLDGLVADSGAAIRVGLTGPPGVGKSSFIERLGLRLIDAGHRVAVLAVDPTSPVSGGSILGDKTRMVELAQHPEAFIRPSPSGGTLGGVASRTREAILVCEAAGYDVVLVETVGVGQSETEVASMVDLFVVLLQPGAGDELQGIKRGVLELAELLVVHKADGEYLEAAERTRADYARALELLRPPSERWRPRVLNASSRTGDGIDAFWQAVLEHREQLATSRELEARRSQRERAWMWSLLDEGLHAALRAHPDVRRRLPALERRVAAREQTAPHAARELLAAFLGDADGES